MIEFNLLKKGCQPTKIVCDTNFKYSALKELKAWLDQRIQEAIGDISFDSILERLGILETKTENITNTSIEDTKSLSINGNVVVSDNLNVQSINCGGTITCSKQLTVNSSASINESLWVEEGLTVNDDLKVTGKTDVDGDVSVKGVLHTDTIYTPNKEFPIIEASDSLENIQFKLPSDDDQDFIAAHVIYENAIKTGSDIVFTTMNTNTGDPAFIFQDTSSNRVTFSLDELRNLKKDYTDIYFEVTQSDIEDYLSEQSIEKDFEDLTDDELLTYTAAILGSYKVNSTSWHFPDTKVMLVHTSFAIGDYDKNSFIYLYKDKDLEDASLQDDYSYIESFVYDKGYFIRTITSIRGTVSTSAWSKKDYIDSDDLNSAISDLEEKTIPYTIITKEDILAAADEAGDDTDWQDFSDSLKLYYAACILGSKRNASVYILPDKNIIGVKFTFELHNINTSSFIYSYRIDSSTMGASGRKVVTETFFSSDGYFVRTIDDPTRGTPIIGDWEYIENISKSEVESLILDSKKKTIGVTSNLYNLLINDELIAELNTLVSGVYDTILSTGNAQSRTFTPYSLHVTRQVRTGGIALNTYKLTCPEGWAEPNSVVATTTIYGAPTTDISVSVSGTQIRIQNITLGDQTPGGDYEIIPVLETLINGFSNFGTENITYTLSFDRDATSSTVTAFEYEHNETTGETIIYITTSEELESPDTSLGYYDILVKNTATDWLWHYYTTSLVPES